MSVFRYLTFVFRLRSIFLFFILIVLLFKYLLRKFRRDPTLVNFAKKMPGPVDYPIIGNTLEFALGYNVGFENLLTKCMLKYGSTVRLWFGSNLAVLLSDPKDIEAALSSPNCMERNSGTEVYSILFGNSIAVARPIEVYKQKRKAYQPFFNRSRSAEQLPAMNDQISKTIEKMKKYAIGIEIDILDLMNDFTFATMTKTFFNYEISDEEKVALDFFKLLKKGVTRLFLKWLCPLKIVDVIMNKLDPMDLPKIRQILNNFVDKLVESSTESTMVEERRLETQDFSSSSFSQSYYDTLKTMQKHLGEEDLIYTESILLIAAGSETTAIALANCLLVLAANPEIQEKAYQELYRIFGDDERLPEVPDLSKLSYLNQIIKEAQRLYTTVPFTIRRVANDTQIGAYIYPKDTMVVINVAGLHHNPRLYPQPHRFNPDNFAPQAVSNRHRCSFIPFGTGIRSCLGKEYGEQMIKLILSACLRNFSFHTHIKLEDVKPKTGGIVQMSSLGYPISIKPRKTDQRP